MKKSVLRKLYIAMISFGLAMGIIFPFYAALFVSFNEGMLVYFVIGALLAGVTVGVSNILFVRFILIKEIRKIDTLAGALTSGDISQEIHLDSNDEIGRIIGNLNQSIVSIGAMIHQMVEISHSMADTISSVNRFEKNLEQLFTSTTQNSQEIQSAIEHIDQSSSSISTTIANLVNQSSSLNDSTASINSTVDGILHRSNEDNTITQSTVSDFSIIRELSIKLQNSSEEIGKMVTVIQDIAKATSLLAVNASVEAAVAGESGRGFRIVADEVKSLSNETMKAATMIETVSQSILEDSEKFITGITTGNSALSSLADHTQRMSRELSQESANMGAIFTSASSIADSIIDIDKQTKQNRQQIEAIESNIESHTVDMKQIGVDFNTMTQNMKTLSLLSEELQKQLWQFRT